MEHQVSGQDAGLALIYVPCGSEEEAVTIARTLLEEGLIACGNIYPSRSIYRWEGAIADEREFLLLCKTARSRTYAAQRRIEQLHSYEIPCILTFAPETVNAPYLSWVNGEVSAPRTMDRGRGLQPEGGPV
jgi:periplasmic divalent cation tolerance protein